MSSHLVCLLSLSIHRTCFTSKMRTCSNASPLISEIIFIFILFTITSCPMPSWIWSLMSTYWTSFECLVSLQKSMFLRCGPFLFFLKPPFLSLYVDFSSSPVPWFPDLWSSLAFLSHNRHQSQWSFLYGVSHMSRVISLSSISLMSYGNSFLAGLLTQTQSILLITDLLIFQIGTFAKPSMALFSRKKSQSLTLKVSPQSVTSLPIQSFLLVLSQLTDLWFLK